MTISNEASRIAMLTRVLAAGGAAAGVEIGIGDDAAVLRAPRAGERLVWTIDEQVEGVHFRRDLASFFDIGWRSLMAAASDVAAMGAAPWCALCALALPPDLDDAWVEELAAGQAAAAQSLSAPVVGGNLSRAPVLAISTTWLGCCERAITRRGARPGDWLWLAGEVGLSAAGLRALERGASASPCVAPAIEAWRRPRALVEEARAMAAEAHAAIDVSDGLARDVGHLARASEACFVLDESALVSEALAVAASTLGEDALDLALHGGEDYALVAASPVPMSGFRRVGSVREGRGLVLVGRGGEHPLETRGYDHFGS